MADPFYGAPQGGYNGDTAAVNKTAYRKIGTAPWGCAELLWKEGLGFAGTDEIKMRIMKRKKDTWCKNDRQNRQKTRKTGTLSASAA